MRMTLACCGVLVALSVGPASAATTSLLSRPGEPPGTTGRGYAPDISPDGRFVAFWDGSVVVVRDLSTGAAMVASRAPDGTAELASGGQSISGEGRLVAFGADRQVFVRDLAAGTTTVASRSSDPGGSPGNDASWGPSMSADGRFVAFTSNASNLGPGDAEAGPPDLSTGHDEGLDVFVRDLQTGATRLVSRASGVAGADGNGASTGPSVSGDGRFVAFQSRATNLSGDDGDALSDVYVRDLETATTIFVGHGPRHRSPDGTEEAGGPSISRNGGSVAFSVFSKFGAGSGAYWTDVLYVHDLTTRATRLVSADSNGAAANGLSPSLSATGRYIAFSSGAPNLQPFTTWTGTDVFVRDMNAGRTVLVSRAADAAGTPGDGGSHGPSISDDGRLVAFESRSKNLNPEDADRSGDIFLRDLGPPPPEPPPPAFCSGRRATTIMLTARFPFRGTPRRDVVVGSREDDRIASGAGDDRLCGGAGSDRLAAGTGADFVRSRDTERDIVFCGPGRDRAVVDARDRVRGCERVDRSQP
jgi:Tol biopolymer transport system component